MLGEQRNDEDIDLDEDSAPNENTDLNANDVTIPTSMHFHFPPQFSHELVNY